MDILLIDDEANKGWKEILEKIFFKEQIIDVALNHQEAKELLEKKSYDLIFLDLRFGEIDHINLDLKNYGGYKVLNELIRKNFSCLNFSTPIMLFTASNKPWNIFEMFNYGVDEFYIKEHPERAGDIQFSQNNTKRLKENIVTLFELGKKRKEIWCKIDKVLKLIDQTINNKNIKNRINEKLRIGYALLFRKVNTLEKNVLLFNNEVNSFITFWSILEEVSHDFFGKKNETEKEWIIKSNNFKIQWFEKDVLKSKFSTIKKEHNTTIDVFDIERGNQVNLSNQIAALLRYRLDWNHQKVRSDFLIKLNGYRNEIDFIHSSTDNILNKEISKTYDSEAAFIKCSYMLDFILKLIK
jgi:CheY-like chemotaxis protein